jgi:UPF0755 protein
MKFKNKIIAVVIIVLTAGTYFGYDIYKKIFLPNVLPEQPYINIPTRATFDSVVKVLAEKKIIKDSASFVWLAKKMKYPSKVQPGHYVLSEGMNNKDLISLLRSGKQTPVKLTFNNIRTAGEFASIVSRTIEADSISLMRLINDSMHVQKFGMNKFNCLVMFIPNTYEFYWNTSAEKFFERMEKEYKVFWTDTRKGKAKAMGLTKAEVSVLASIVEQETKRDDEKPVIAGVYLNRFNKGWRLEADPTLVFALGDFSVNRVLSAYKEIDSPYNTYKYPGFPPGPICMPSIASIDAVLNYSKHSYMYFCARPDFSGYHSFAMTYTEHLINARRFQKELNKRNIRS